MAKKGQKFQKYPLELKEEIINQYLHSKSASFLSQKYGVPIGTIRTWSYNYRHGHIGKKKGRPKTNNLTLEDYKERYEILKKYQAFLLAQRERK